MSELKEEISVLVDSIDNPKILENLKVIIIDYVSFYAARKQKNEED